jgi:hypothetical protein
VDYSFDPEFVGCTNRLSPTESQRVWKAVERYQADPGHRSLNLEKLQGRGRRRLWSIRASDELRLLLAREGDLTLFLRAGHHEDIYKLSDNNDFVVPVAGAPGLITVEARVDFNEVGVASERGNTTDADIPVPHRDCDEIEPRALLAHWEKRELLQEGFTDSEIEILHSASVDTLLESWPGIDEDTLTRVLEMAEKSPDSWRQTSLLNDQDDGVSFRQGIVERGALGGLSGVMSADEVRRLASQPIEDWMVFLHPEQRALVDRRFNGPARVRGAAGTGKTVVALHRAAALAKRLKGDGNRANHPVLFTTFISNLPPVFRNLYKRLPTAVEGAVEFINIDKLANRICTRGGMRLVLDTRTTDSAFAHSCNTVIQFDTPLHKAQLTRRYLREEVTAVIKGRGVDSLNEYLSLERTGRRTPFTSAMREQVWELRLDWDRRLGESGVVDFPDIVRAARDLALQREEPMFDAAIVDESQDITLVGLQLIRALVNGSKNGDRPDGLFIAGDGAQRIYAGGFTLAQAGIDVRGNSTVLRVNYRNTRQIIETALACAGNERIEDLEEEYERGDVSVVPQRDGVPPIVVSCKNIDGQIVFVDREVRRLQDTGAIGYGDVCVCAPTNRLVHLATKSLRARGINCQDLSQFDGTTNDSVKVGTFHRAKGLEFKVVFLMGLSASEFPSPQAQGQSDAEYSDQKALQISQLFVAMTRARDGLFVLCDGEVCSVLSERLDHFELITAE